MVNYEVTPKFRTNLGAIFMSMILKLLSLEKLNILGRILCKQYSMIN